MPYPDLNDLKKHAETMLYVSPGPHDHDGVKYDYIVVRDDEVAAKLEEGWSRTPAEAAAKKAEKKPAKA